MSACRPALAWPGRPQYAGWVASRVHFLEATEFTPSGPPCGGWNDGDGWTTNPEDVNCLACQRILARDPARARSRPEVPDPDEPTH